MHIIMFTCARSYIIIAKSEEYSFKFAIIEFWTQLDNIIT